MSQSIYLNIAKHLEEQIIEGKYKVEERLPSERKLALIYEVSRMTIRQALLYLEDKGVVYRQGGSGTYVKAHSFQQNNVKSFTETIGDMGFSVSTKVLEFSTIYSMEKISAILSIPQNSEFYKMKRLRLGNEIPMALEVLYIPKTLCPNLEKHDINGSFYKLLEEVYSIKVSKVNYQIEAVIANPIHAQIMELHKPTALLKVSGTSLESNNKKLFYEESLYRSDLYHYQVDIHRKF